MPTNPYTITKGAINSNNNTQENDLELQQILEQERFLQEERIRRSREEDTKIMQEERGENDRSIGKVTFASMVTVALVIDVILAIISFIPFIGWIINILISMVTFMTFFMWFRTHGIKFNSPNKMLALPASFLLELIPYLNILPGWTVAVFMTTAVDKISKTI